MVPGCLISMPNRGDGLSTLFTLAVYDGLLGSPCSGGADRARGEQRRGGSYSRPSFTSLAFRVHPCGQDSLLIYSW